ncbi:hypothetical protein MKK63_05705 [Methylobacterium sp. J-088]|nr:hypothetical protein [Methylobacterium sp. J-088]
MVVNRTATPRDQTFSAETMPVTAALIEHVFQDGELAVLAVKAVSDRPRPYTLKPDLTTFGHQSISAAYLSSHAPFAYLAATVRAQLVPDKRQAQFEFAASYGAIHMIANFPSPFR